MILRRKYHIGDPTDHFDGGRFFLPNKPFSYRYRDIMKWRLGPRNRWPKKVVGVKVSDIKDRVDKGLRVTNIGHSTLLIQTEKLNILTDPQFSLRAGPVVGPRRVQAPGLKIKDLPHIDIVFVSHNHYDHLDLASLRKICRRDNPIIITPLGNDYFISKVRWAKKIYTLDWYEKISVKKKVIIQLLPAQHWSSRTPFDRNRALWGSACFYFEKSTFLFVSDTGFDEEMFKKIKDSIHEIPDIIALPIGCYSPRWIMAYNHMTPEEAWQAFTILKGKKFLPIHYDVFPLADEPFGEPLERLKKASKRNWSKVIPLKVGEIFEI